MVTLDQKVEAVTHIIMTGSPKAEVARTMNVAESTFRGWCKNKDIVARAQARCDTLKCMAAAPGRPAAAVREDSELEIYNHQQAQINRYWFFYHYALLRARALATVQQHGPSASTVSSQTVEVGSAPENPGTESRSSSSGAAEEVIEEPLDLTTHSRNRSRFEQ